MPTKKPKTPQEKIPEGAAKRAELESDVANLRDVNKNRPKQITNGRVQLANHSRNVYHASIPYGDTLQEILEPHYWAHLQHQLRPLDIIEAVSDDLSLDVELRVIAVQFNQVQVQVRSKVEYEKVDLGPDVPSEYDIKFAGLYEKWRVLHQGKVLVTKLETADHARLWLRDHLKAKAM